MNDEQIKSKVVHVLLRAVAPLSAVDLVINGEVPGVQMAHLDALEAERRIVGVAHLGTRWYMAVRK